MTTTMTTANVLLSCLCLGLLCLSQAWTSEVVQSVARRQTSFVPSRRRSQTRTIRPASLQVSRVIVVVPRSTTIVSRLRASVQEEAVTDNVMMGVDDFEAWFRSIPGASCVPSIVHQDFGNLRGLGWTTTPKGAAPVSKEPLMTIPRSVVLRSDFSRPDWDVQLALNLWTHVLSQPSSSSSPDDVSGYVALLTRGWRAKKDLPSPPPSTAVDALRHWTTEEKALLLAGDDTEDKNPVGRRLLDLQQQQDDMWRRKYDALGPSSSKLLTWEQFVWAMEVVHSRAFCGDFGSGGDRQLPPIVTVASPLVAALAGYTYYVTMHGQDDLVLVGFALVAALPSVINFILSSSKASPVAVLLPLIDSANHRQEADSVIEYTPLSNAFTLRGGPKCLVTEADGQQQLYISYGIKKDTELLLNYGFLPGCSSMGGTMERRRHLAEQFLARNAR